MSLRPLLGAVLALALASYHCTVVRQVPGTDTTFTPAEALPRHRALRFYTLSNARMAFEENTKCILAPGKLADIAVLSQNILTVPAGDLLRTEVDYTIVGGNIAYTRE